MYENSIRQVVVHMSGFVSMCVWSAVYLYLYYAVYKPYPFESMLMSVHVQNELFVGCSLVNIGHIATNTPGYFIAIKTLKMCNYTMYATILYISIRIAMYM